MRLELIISDDRHDLIAEGVDVAIRMGTLQDSGFGARLLTMLQRTLVASPGYFERRSIPQHPDELAGHDLIFGPGIVDRSQWRFHREGELFSVEVVGRIQVNSSEGLIACVQAGLGIAMASEGMVLGDMGSGSVVRVLPDFELPTVPVHAVYPAGPRPSAKVRALVDHLASTFSASDTAL